MAIAGLASLAACAGEPNQANLPPARSTSPLPFGVNPGEVETPNSLPPGFTTRNPIAPDTGVVGVTHLPP